MTGHYDSKNCLKVPLPSDDLVFSSSGVLFWAVSCDLVGMVREDVPVSETAIVTLQIQVSRQIIGEPTVYHSRQTVHWLQ